MKLIRVECEKQRHVGIVTENGIVPIEAISTKRGRKIPNDLLAIIQEGGIPDLGRLDEMETIPFDAATPLLPYEVPPKIWCIGLNYHSHAVDINAAQPEEPGSF